MIFFVLNLISKNPFLTMYVDQKHQKNSVIRWGIALKTINYEKKISLSVENFLQ